MANQIHVQVKVMEKQKPRKTIARQIEVEGRSGKGRWSRPVKRRQDKKPYIPRMRGRERLASQILTILPFAQGLVVLYQPKRARSLQQPLLEAKQLLIKALFFFKMYTEIYKKLATDKSKEKKNCTRKKVKFQIASKFSKYEFYLSGRTTNIYHILINETN